MKGYITDLNTVVGRVARGYTLAYIPADRAYYLLSIEERLPEARVSELTVEQLVQEGMFLDPTDTSDDRGVLRGIIEFDFIFTVKCERCGDRIREGDVPKDATKVLCMDCEQFLKELSS